MSSKSPIPYTHVHRFTIRLLEPAQDVLVVAVALTLFGVMVRTVASLFFQVFRSPLDFRGIIAEVLFMLVMVEVVRLLVIYLGEHRIAVDFMVELGIVATLREIVLKGVTELTWQQISAITAFLLALGTLLRFGDLRVMDNAGQGSLTTRSDTEPHFGRFATSTIAESLEGVANEQETLQKRS